jgi:ABC-type polysaccharide transport system, permease component
MHLAQSKLLLMKHSKNPLARASFLVVHKWQLLLMFALPFIWYLVFCYFPMYGIQIAFRNYIPRKSFDAGTWVGLKHFARFFSSYNAWPAIGNTLSINLGCLLIGFPAPILLAILLNQIRSNSYKKLVQNITYIPYFLSIVVVVSMLKLFTDQQYGVFNVIIRTLGGTPMPFMESDKFAQPMYVLSNVWQNMGWNAIIYIAALAGIDPTLYEAATIDGASRLKKILHVSIPGISSTIITLFILRIGQLLTIGFEKALLMQNNLNMGALEIISTLVYKIGIQQGDYSYAAAVGLMNSIANLILIFVANITCKRVFQESLW